MPKFFVEVEIESDLSIEDLRYELLATAVYLELSETEGFEGIVDRVYRKDVR